MKRRSQKETEAKKMSIAMMKTEELIPYAQNAKQHPPEQIEKIAISIDEFGFNVPLIIDDKNTIVAGHGRLLAAQKLGLDEVPCICVEHLTQSQIRLFRLADNRATESPWDTGVLREELMALSAMDLDLTLSVFDVSELQAFTKEEIPEQKNIVPDKDPNILCRISFHPGIWLGKRQEILNIFDRMVRTYECKIKVEE